VAGWWSSYSSASRPGRTRRLVVFAVVAFVLTLEVVGVVQTLVLVRVDEVFLDGGIAARAGRALAECSTSTIGRLREP